LTRRPGPGAARVALVAAVVLVVAVLGPGSGAVAGAYPPLPLSADRGFLGNLSAPSLAPSGTGSISFTVGNPLSAPISAAELTFQVYAFNGFPGNATSTVSVAGAPVLANATASGGSVGVTVGTLSPGAVFRGSVDVATSATTPSGAFAVRTALAFLSNGTAYRLESRGWFNSTVWAAATELPNGSATLNLTVLGVSGVLPETAIVVAASTLTVALAVVLVVAVVFVGLGAWVYFRRGPASNSGAR